MRLRQLECFVRTCELGSISKAADQLRLTQPAVGLQIKNLEEAFGTILFVRTSRGVTPTPAGEILLEWARDVIERTKAVRDRLKRLSHEHRSILTVGLTPSITYMLAGTILQEAARRIPKLSLQIIEGLTRSIMEWVLDERVDLALVSGDSQTTAISQTPLLREHLYQVCAPNSPRTRVPLSKVLVRPLVMPGEGDAIRRVVDGEARKLDLPLTVTYEIASIHVIKDLAARGVANAILPFGAVQREVAAGSLVARRICNPHLSRTLYLVRLSSRRVSTPEQHLVQVIKDCLRGLIAGEPRQAYELLTGP